MVLINRRATDDWEQRTGRRTYHALDALSSALVRLHQSDRYLTVNGVEPTQNAYTNGVLPGSGAGNGAGADPGLGFNITFKGMNDGDYPIWSVLRLVSARTPYRRA